MDKTLKLQLGGKEVTLNLGINEFYEIFLEETGIDLYKEGLVDIESIKMVKYVKGFVIAGVKANALLNGGEVNAGELRKAIAVMNVDETMETFLRCAAVRAGKTYEELKNQAAQAEEMKKEPVSEV